MSNTYLSEKFESILEDCLSAHGYSTFRLNTTPNKNVKKSTGSIFSVMVEGRKDREFKIEFLVVKCLEDPEEKVKAMKTDLMFETEAFIYNEVFAKFNDLQKDLPMTGKMNFPLCYKAGKDYVIMEDLNMKNFAVEEETNMLNYDQVAFALMDLARIHTFSFAMRQKNDEEFINWTKDLRRNFFTYKELDDRVVDEAVQKALNVIDNDTLKKKLTTACKGAADKVKALCQPNLEDEKTAVICHGDFTSENILFTYDENDEPSNVMIIDYQLSSLMSPAIDLWCLLLTSSSPGVLSQYERIVDVYFNSLSVFLKKFQCLAKDCYPLSTLEADLKKYFICGLIRMLLTAPNQFNSKNVEENEKAYKSKINEVVETLNELKLL